jgi:pimeloyl-ACP methyl ester carboxylesterase
MRLELISHVPQTPTQQTPILFLHGAWHGAWCWEDYFLPYFAQKGYAAHAMSLRSHGLSEGRKKIRWTSIDDYVTDLYQVVKSLPKPPVIVAHSLGGFVLQRYLEYYDTPAAVLIAPAPARGGFSFTWRMLRTTPGAYLRSGLTLSPYALVNTIERTQTAFFSKTMPRVDVERHFARIQEDSIRAYLDFLMFSLPNTRDIRERNIPTLIIGGANDQLFHPNEFEALAKTYNADITILPDTAHDVMLEANWQQATDRIMEWLKEKGIE